MIYFLSPPKFAVLCSVHRCGSASPRTKGPPGWVCWHEPGKSISEIWMPFVASRREAFLDLFFFLSSVLTICWPVGTISVAHTSDRYGWTCFRIPSTLLYSLSPLCRWLSSEAWGTEGRHGRVVQHTTQSFLKPEGTLLQQAASRCVYVPACVHVCVLTRQRAHLAVLSDMRILACGLLLQVWQKE